MAKNKGGRPSIYEAEWQNKLVVIQGWARDGLTNEQIAKNMGISVKTLYEWQNKYSEFREALKKGKEIVDREVENALLKRALGYKYTEITRERVTEINSETGEPESRLVVTKEVTKEVVPDVTAQIFWLKNRKPNEWKDKRDIGINGDMDINNNPFRGLTTEELKKLIENDN